MHTHEDIRVLDLEGKSNVYNIYEENFQAYICLQILKLLHIPFIDFFFLFCFVKNASSRKSQSMHSICQCAI